VVNYSHVILVTRDINHRAFLEEDDIGKLADGNNVPSCLAACALAIKQLNLTNNNNRNKKVK